MQPPAEAGGRASLMNTEFPHAMMRCGAPNGHTVLTIKDFDYSLRFIPAGRDASQQMHLFLPGAIDHSNLASTEVVANIWAGSPRTTVRMRIDGGRWTTMKQDARPDPYLEMEYVSEAMNRTPRGRRLSEPVKSSHIWVADLPESLAPGGHVVEVESTDQFGQVDNRHRIFRVVGKPSS